MITKYVAKVRMKSGEIRYLKFNRNVNAPSLVLQKNLGFQSADESAVKAISEWHWQNYWDKSTMDTRSVDPIKVFS